MKRVLSLLLVLVLSLGLLAACGGDGEDGNGSAVADSNNAATGTISFIDNGTSVYRVVRPTGDKAAQTAAIYLIAEMKKILGTGIKGGFDNTDGTDTYEILIGDTNRPETATVKERLFAAGGRYNDYIISVIGKKIVIYSQNPDSLQVATEHFMTDFVRAEGYTGVLEYIKATEGNFDSIKINGVEAGKFNFVRPHYNSSYLTEVEMEEIQDFVFQKTGYMIPISHDTKVGAKDYEIIVGNSEREGVQKLTNYDEFTVKVSGKKVFINGGSAHATAVAVSEFGKMLQKGTVADTDSITGSYEAVMATVDRSTEYYKTWGDDFDGDTLDLNKWQLMNEGWKEQGLNGKMSARCSDPEYVYVRDGSFTICAHEDEQYYYGGMIRTQRSMEYKYGYLEASMLLPHGDGFWIALWACSNDTGASADSSLPKLTSPEIDIVECFGNTNSYAANCHAWPTDAGKEAGFVHTSLDGTHSNDKKYTIEGENARLGDGFHTYGLLWDNTQMSFTCDGDLFFKYDTTTNENDKEAFNHSMYLIFSMATAYASSPIPKVTDKIEEWQNTNKYSIDWINIYQKDDGLSELRVVG